MCLARRNRVIMFDLNIPGLAIRVKLLRSLPPRFKVDVQIRPGTHASEVAVNKQVKV